MPVRTPDEGGPASDDRGRVPGIGHRAWWHWLLIGLLVAVSVGVTALFGATLVTDLVQRHWAQAVDTTREAVPAAVGWGALFMIFFVGGTRVTRRSPADPGDLGATELRDAATQLRAAAEDDAVRQAEECVQSLTARLRMLAAGEHAESGCAGPDGSLPPDPLPPDPDPGSAHRWPPHPAPPQPMPPQQDRSHQERSLAREVAETSARLDRARQWLISAQAALAATRETAAPLVSQHGGRNEDP